MDGTHHAAGVGDPFNLGRFVEAQGPVYSSALRELQRGRKTTHWIWFIFPQLRGLGYSSTSKYYAISGGDEAQQYLGHPLLGARLVECSRAVLGHAGRSALDIFGSPDDVKLRSCMTCSRPCRAPIRCSPRCSMRSSRGSATERRSGSSSRAELSGWLTGS